MINTQPKPIDNRLCNMFYFPEHSIQKFIFPFSLTEENFQQGGVALVKSGQMSLNERMALGFNRNPFFNFPTPDFTHRLREQLISWISERLHYRNRTLCEQVKYLVLPNNWVFLYI